MENEIEIPSNMLTVAHVMSESGDSFVRVFAGYLTSEEIRQTVYDEAPDWWEDPEWVSLGDVLHVRTHA